MSRLSTDQIDALFEAAKDGELPSGDESPTPARRRRIRDVDFTRPTKLAADHVRRLELAHKIFGRNSGTQLSAELRVTVTLEVLGIDELSWSTAIGQVPQPSLFVVAKVVPFGTSIVLSAELPLAMALLERLLGGSVASRVPHRQLTEIEQPLVRRMFEGLVQELSEALREQLNVTLEYTSLELDPSAVRIAQPSEPTIAVTVETKLEGTSASMLVLAPYRSLAPAFDQLSSSSTNGGANPDPVAAEWMAETLGGVPVLARVEVGSVDIPLGELLALETGAVVRLGVPTAAGVTVCAGPLSLCRGLPGRFASRRAVSVQTLEGGL